MTTHNLKTWFCYFIEVLAGNKTFELRKNDRDYKVGDTLNLIEVDEINFELDPINQTKHYLTTGRTHTAKITYILEGGQFGLDKDYVILGMK
jgi:hypothetical protein